MSSIEIKAAIEKAIDGMLPALTTVYENRNTQPPNVDTGYQEVTVLMAAPDNPEFGSGHREQGFFQVTLKYPAGKGTGAALERAELLRSTFYRGASFIEGDIRLIIERTPEIPPGYHENGRWVIPVKIRFYANVF